MSPSPSEITLLLDRAQGGDGGARDELFRLIYDELRELARSYLKGERAGHTLEATALVNEVCVGLLKKEALPGTNRGQFRAFVAKAMRHVLIDHARERQRKKRGGNAQRVPLTENLRVEAEPSLDLLALDAALEELATVDERKARVVELRYFGGLEISEVADAVGVSAATVKRDWDVARTWLLAEMRSHDTHGE